MELIRSLLLNLEGNGEAHDVSGFANDYIGHNCALILDAGLAKGDVILDENGMVRGAIFLRLTWAGHDFWDSIREPAMWNKVKSTVLRQGASWTFELLKEYVKHELRERFHLPIDPS